MSSPHKQYTSSEPAIMPSQEYSPNSPADSTCNTEISSPTDQKRRRLQCHSLDDIDPRICTPPSPFKTQRGMKGRKKSPLKKFTTALSRPSYISYEEEDWGQGDFKSRYKMHHRVSIAPAKRLR